MPNLYPSNNTQEKTSLHTDDSHAIPATDEVLYFDTSPHENIKEVHNSASFGCRPDLQQVDEQRPQILQYNYCEQSGRFQPNIPETNQV